MSYNEGDIVVHPKHGCCKVVKIEDKEGKAYIKFKTLSELNNDLTITLPLENLGKVGVRNVITPERADKILDIFKIKKGEEKKMNWSKRFKINQEKVFSGDLKKVAEVVRDLSEKTSDMANGEKKILVQAKDILYTEIAISKNMSETEVEELFRQSSTGEKRGEKN